MAVADALVALDPDVRITALGTARGLETRLVPERGYALELITPVPLPRKPTGDLARLPARVLRAVRQARAVLDKVDADVVIGFGGYVSLPAYLAARPVTRRRRRVPVVIHEANASAGLANRIGARSAQRVLSAVPDPGLPHAEVVGVPVRAAITSLDRAALRSEARAHFGFADDARVLLVFGGSQGAASLNRAVVAAAAEPAAAAGVSVLHAHGAEEPAEPTAPAGDEPPYVAVPYLNRMDLAYAAADVAICRSGAMTVAEVTAVGLPAIYVPLPIGNGEQRLNALPVVDAGGGLIVADADLTPEFVADTVAGLLNDAPRFAAMTDAAARVGHRDAALQVARVALDVAIGHAAPGDQDDAASLPPELQRVHMVGIGGAGMSGIARILLDRGAQVSGSDAKESRGVLARCGPAAPRFASATIRRRWICCRAADGGDHHACCDPEDQPRVGRGPPPRHSGRAAAHGAGQADVRLRTVMVTGTHGKTTTTSMLIVALQHCGLDPSFAVGGELGEAGTNAHHGSGDCFVAEADESDGSLLEYTPNVAVVTNIEADHLDFFGSTDAYTAVFDDVRRTDRPGRRAGRLYRRPGRRRAGGTRCGAGDPGAAVRSSERPAQLSRTLLLLGAAGDRGGRARQAGRREPSAGDAAVGAGPAHGAECAGRVAGRGRSRRPGRVRARRVGRIRRRP